MKYVATAISLSLMIWTWSLAHSQRDFSLAQHSQVAVGVEQDIRAFIERKFPDTKDIYCLQLYTEIAKPGVELIAHFRCQATGSLKSQGLSQGLTTSAAAPTSSATSSSIIGSPKSKAATVNAPGADTGDENEEIEQIFEGYLNLKSDDGFATWSETGGEIRAPEIRFRNGLSISAKSGATHSGADESPEKLKLDSNSDPAQDSGTESGPESIKDRSQQEQTNVRESEHGSEHGSGHDHEGHSH